MSDIEQLISAIEGDWRVRARPEQLLPSGDWVIWLYCGGRGTGKTRSGAEAVKEEIETGRSRRIGMIAPTTADIRDVMLEGESGLLNLRWARAPVFEPSKRRVTFEGGAIVTTFSAEEADRLRGPQHDFLWCDELAAWKDARHVWDMAMFGLRLGKRPRAIVTTTPRPIPLLMDLVKRVGQDVAITRGRTIDNAQNLPPSFLNEIVKRYQGTRLGRQELDAEILTDVPGALFTRDLIETTRHAPRSPATLKRVVVGIDPAVTTGEKSDATGIVVAGIGDDDHVYVIDDLSGKMTPHEWAKRATDAQRMNQADRIIAEANNGGQLVADCIRQIDPHAPIKLVHASRGKISRAEPVAALWEQHRAHLCGTFPELEDEMCTYEAGNASPDRLDALVWAVTELAVQRPRCVAHFA